MKQLEQDKIKVFPKATALNPYPLMNPLCSWMLQQVKIFAIYTDLFEEIWGTSSLKGFHKFAVDNISLMTSPQLFRHIFENNFNFLRGELYIAKAKLLANKYKCKSFAISKRPSSDAWCKQDQTNFIFKEFTFYFSNWPSHYQTQEEADIYIGQQYSFLIEIERA